MPPAAVAEKSFSHPTCRWGKCPYPIRHACFSSAKSFVLLWLPFIASPMIISLNLCWGTLVRNWWKLWSKKDFAYFLFCCYNACHRTSLPFLAFFRFAHSEDHSEDNNTMQSPKVTEDRWHLAVVPWPGTQQSFHTPGADIFHCRFSDKSIPAFAGAFNTSHFRFLLERTSADCKIWEVSSFCELLYDPLRDIPSDLLFSHNSFTEYLTHSKTVKFCD